MKYVHLTLLLLFSSSVNSQVSLAKIFGDNMVLRRHTDILVWGFAKANTGIEVVLNLQKTNTTIDESGKWMVFLKPEKAGGPFELLEKGENTVVIKKVLIGEVWICSG